MEIEIRRPFTKEEGKSAFRAIYDVTDVPNPGCVQVTVTLATRIQLSQEIARRGVKYSEALLAEIAKELVAAYIVTGGDTDPDCDPGPSPDAIYIDYGDFNMLARAAISLTSSPEE